MKLRIIPTVLYNDNLCVKGKNFKSWRVSGSLKQTIKLYSLREVDELIFFNINANTSKINLDTIDEFADEYGIQVEGDAKTGSCHVTADLSGHNNYKNMA